MGPALCPGGRPGRPGCGPLRRIGQSKTEVPPARASSTHRRARCRTRACGITAQCNASGSENSGGDEVDQLLDRAEQGRLEVGCQSRPTTRMRRQAARPGSACGHAEGRADALLPVRPGGTPARRRARAGRGGRPARCRRTDGRPPARAGRRRRRARRWRASLAGHEMVEQHTEPPPRAGPEVADHGRPGGRRRRGTRPRPLRPAGRLPTPARPARRRGGPRPRSAPAAARATRAGAPCTATGARGGARSRQRRRGVAAGDARHRASRRAGSLGPSRERRARGRAGPRGPAHPASTASTAPQNPVSASSTTIPSSTGCSTARPRGGAFQSPASTSPPYRS